MIFIDRDAVPPPKWFASGEHHRRLGRLHEEYAKAVKQRVQSDLFNPPALRGIVLPALLKLTHFKCAYCETRTGSSSSAGVDLYRPRVLGSDKDARDHYYWLALEWTNMLPACQRCNRAKRNLFPIGKARCEVGATGRVLDREQPLLLDPSHDRPERFISFNTTGEAIVVDQAEDAQRARATIDVLALNRTFLVEARRAAASRVDQFCETLVASIDGRAAHAVPDRAIDQFVQTLMDAIDDRAEFAAMSRVALANHLPSLRRIPRLAKLDRRFSAITGQADGSNRPRVSPGAAESLVRVATIESQPAGAVLSSATVQSVNIERFRALPQATLTLPESRPDDVVVSAFASLDTNTKHHRTTGWKVILGENGSGKSSILHAIALALMGKEFYERKKEDYRLEASLQAGAIGGSITVSLSDEATPISLALSPNGIEWTYGEEGAPVFVRGYGATRLLPRLSGSHQTTGPGELIPKRVDSLFDPYAELVDAPSWLRGLNDYDYREAAVALRSLLALESEDANLEFEFTTPVRSGRFGLRRNGAFTPLEHFSAGYQSLLALGCDIMAGIGTTISEIHLAPGIVLIDEIGTNLHPRWRMQIVDRLGRMFSRMQFIASTHEPLCLRGLGSGEVALVSLEKGVPSVNDAMPSPAGLRVDQLLTSHYFGLHTTTDPETEAAFDAYYDLLAREKNLLPLEKERLALLRDQLRQRSVLGSSRRDQLILKIIDDVIAHTPKGQPASPSAEVVDRVRRALSEMKMGGTRARTP